MAGFTQYPDHLVHFIDGIAEEFLIDQKRIVR